jgi:aldose 1-epimerase
MPWPWVLNARTVGPLWKFSRTAPGAQLYTAIHLNASIVGSGGVTYPKWGGFCLETQHYPDSPNKPNSPSVVLEPERNSTA